MYIDTRAIGFPLTEAIRLHVESRLHAALGPVPSQVILVIARLEAVNASRGGRDMRCRFVALLAGRGTVLAEATSADLYTAVERAARRLRTIALRAILRPHAWDRRESRRPRSLLTV